MVAYMIFCIVEVNDENAMRRYRAAAQASLAAHRPRILCGPRIVDTLEGVPFLSSYVMEFASRASADAWYHSPEYQAAVRIREHAASIHAFILDG